VSPTLLPLLALAPALGSFMRPPGAVLTIAELHLHAMLATPAFRGCLLAFGLLLCGKALEQRFQSCQQALFVAISQGHLHLATSEGDVDIRAGRSLWQCWDYLTREMC
jgi:hypothetical protein